MKYQVKIASGNWTDADALGVSGLERVLRHAGEDTLTVTLTGQTVATDALLAWAHGAAVSLRRTGDAGGDPELLFSGTVSGLTRAATGASESATVTVAGPWAILEKTVYRQQWLEPDSGTSPTAAAAVYVPRAVLYRGWDAANSAETRVDTVHQILDALALAAESSPGSFAVPPEGDGEGEAEYPAGFHPPYDEQTNVTCAEVARRALAMHPNLCLWFDHSTSPPAARLAMREDLARKSVALTDCESVEVTRRDDLTPPAVCLAYVKTGSLNGRTYTCTDFDMAGPSGLTPQQVRALMYAPGTLWGVYEMEGPAQEYAEQTCTVRATRWGAWADDAEKAAWWKAHCPEIAGYGTVTILASPAPATDALYGNFLLEGAVQTWQKKHVQEATFTCRAKVARTDVETREIDLRFTATVTDLGGTIGDLLDHEVTDRRQIAFDSGEMPPSGFAAALYAEWSAPQWEGGVTLRAQETPSGHAPGERLNVTGGASAWAAMDALVTEVREDLATGALTLGIGPGGWIDLDSRVAWLRACRSRRYSWRRQLKDAGADNAGCAVGIDGTPLGAEGSSPAAWYRVRFRSDGQTAHTLDIDPAHITDQTARAARFRKILALEQDASGNLVARQIWALCTESTVIDGHQSDLPVYDLRYNTTDHRLEAKRDGENWVQVTGGDAVPEGS